MKTRFNYPLETTTTFLFRSPNFPGRDWKVDGVSNNTQRSEDHLRRARIFVGNVDARAVSRNDLIAVFSKHGDVAAVSIHSGYSFIQMDSERSANRAVNYENGATLNGCKISKCSCVGVGGFSFCRFLGWFSVFLKLTFRSLFCLSLPSLSLPLSLLLFLSPFLGILLLCHLLIVPLLSLPLIIDVEFSSAALKAGARCK